MIKINKNTANTVVLTLNEKKTLDNPVFLFRFTSDSTRADKAFIASDISTEKQRFNEFIVTEDPTEDLLNATVDLDPPGLWKYEIWEQTSTTNLDYLLATNIVEVGIVRVIGAAQVLKKYTDQPTEYTVYES